MRVLFYFGCLLATLAYAWWRGGRAERFGALLLIAATLLTMLAGSPAVRRFASVETGILVVDVAILAAFLWLALFSDRYWPLWIAALQLIAVLAHFAKLADLEMPRNGYAFLQAFWSYPIMLAVVIGTRSFHKARTRKIAGGTLRPS